VSIADTILKDVKHARAATPPIPAPKGTGYAGLDLLSPDIRVQRRRKLPALDLGVVFGLVRERWDTIPKDPSPKPSSTDPPRSRGPFYSLFGGGG
jgi:hypothetical protein